MSTIKTILEANADGTLHLPVPPELRHGKIEVNAILKPANGDVPLGQPHFGCLAGKVQLSPDFDQPLDDFNEYLR